MPIEIRELHIRVTVSENESTAWNQARPDGREEPVAMVDQERIVAECVEKVLEIMQNKSER